MNYYNEFDPQAAAWLRGLIAEGLIPPGVVDERSIIDIKPYELTDYTQCHFFAGIGGWSLALQLAGIPDHVRLWTGSCPCQPFSTAGRNQGEADERHLWPVFFDLIRECRPERVFGEQVENAVRHGWLDGISADLEGEGYACGAVVLGAHSVGSPHIRQRLFWVADSERHGSEAGMPEPEQRKKGLSGVSDNCSDKQSSRLADTDRQAWGVSGISGKGNCPDSLGRDAEPRDCVPPVGVDDGQRERCAARGNRDNRRDDGKQPCPTIEDGWMGVADSDRRQPWDDSNWHLCRDGKHRRVPTESALFPLADGVSYKLARRRTVRPALLKGSGNAIVPQVAAAFVTSFFNLTP